jgi:hypothetical protein
MILTLRSQGVSGMKRKLALRCGDMPHDPRLEPGFSFSMCCSELIHRVVQLNPEVK